MGVLEYFLSIIFILFLIGRTLKGLRITLRLLGGTFPYNPLCITVNFNFTIDKHKLLIKIILTNKCNYYKI